MNRDRTPEPAAGDATSDLLTRLRPQARMDEAWSAERHEAAYQQVLARIERERPTFAAARTPVRRPGARRTARPWLTLAAAAGAAAAVGVIAIGAPGATDRPEAPRPATTAERPGPGASPGARSSAVPAATFLRDVALVAAEQPPDEHRDAPFWYTRAQGRGDARTCAESDVGRRLQRGRAALRHAEVSGWAGSAPGRIVGPRWERGRDDHGWPDPPPGTSVTPSLTWEQLDELPTDPAALRRRFDAELAEYRTEPTG